MQYAEKIFHFTTDKKKTLSLTEEESQISKEEVKGEVSLTKKRKRCRSRYGSMSSGSSHETYAKSQKISKQNCSHSRRIRRSKHISKKCKDSDVSTFVKGRQDTSANKTEELTNVLPVSQITVPEGKDLSSNHHSTSLDASLPQRTCSQTSHSDNGSSRFTTEASARLKTVVPENGWERLSCSRSRSESRSKSRSSSCHSGRRTSLSWSSSSRSRSHSRSYSGTRSPSWSPGRHSFSKSRSRSKNSTTNVTDHRSRYRSERSPSIRRRHGSPCYLDKRRITSARKRPVPYTRRDPSSSSDSDSSSSCRSRSYISRSRFSSLSRSPSLNTYRGSKK